MVNPPTPGTNADLYSDERTVEAAIPFSLIGDSGAFTPRYFPTRLNWTKEHEVERKDSFCGGEDVNDKGPKNREIHINGRVLSDEKITFDRIVEKAEKFEMTSATWSGEVVIETAELEGPVAIDGRTGRLMWEYTLDVVSTGADEGTGMPANDGIISGVTPDADT